MRLKIWEYLIFGLQLTTIIGLDLDMVIMCPLVWCQFLGLNFFHVVCLRFCMPTSYFFTDVHVQMVS